MILELDVGNSRAKWRVIDERGQRIAGGANSAAADAMFTGVPPASVGAGSLTRVRVSNVTGAETESVVRAWCASVASVTPEFAASEARRGPVINGYGDPRRLGVDRWLAILAAWQRVEGACCIVDCGSALTVDFVSGTGEHLGGLIAPGLAMMRSSLLRDTREIRLVDAETPWDRGRLGGRSTEEAVLGGTIGMASELILGSLRRFRAHGDGDAALLITGGEAEVVGAQLDEAWEHCPDLVLDGLAVALP